MPVDMDDPKMEGYIPFQTIVDENDDTSSYPNGGEPGTRRKYAMSVHPQNCTFPGTVVDTTTAAATVLLVSVGYATLTISSITVVGDFALVPDEDRTFPLEVLPGAIQEIQVTFTPTVAGARTGGIYIETGDAAGKEFIPLSGSGVVE